MIVSHFLLWARRAPPGQRAEAVSALARAYLHSDLSARDRWEAETALTAMLDDPSTLVRRSLAEALASSPDAPRPVVVALAHDGSEVAAIVLARSPVIADADLVDIAALGDGRVQSAIASRPWLSPAVCAALAEIGGATALQTLAENKAAPIPDASLFRMVERHGDEPGLREALLRRQHLPVAVQQAVAAALAAHLERFVVGCGWLSGERGQRVARDARERTTVALTSEAGRGDVERLVTHLRGSGQLTPALLLRAILSGADRFLLAAFAELAGHPDRKVAAILGEPEAAAFRALYGKAGLPASLRPAFAAALAARRDAAPGAGIRLSRPMVEHALAACENLPEEEGSRLLALLRRFEMEAARDDARLAASGLADEAALRIVRSHAPEELDGFERVDGALAA